MICNKITIDNGIDTSDATANSSNIDSGKTAYVNGEKITGTSTKVDTSDATASAAEISSGKTAYVNGSKVTGTNTVKAVKSVTYSSYMGNMGATPANCLLVEITGISNTSITISPKSTIYFISRHAANTYYRIEVKPNY